MEVVVGDITRLRVDVVVNAANQQLAGGGGVDGAIHQAAGYQELQQACRQLGGCPTGQVVMTAAFNLSARYIFHAVGPVWRGGASGEQALLASCYRQAMVMADELGVCSIAFPAISSGIYGYPPALAAPVAVSVVRAQLDQGSSLQRAIFCCFDEVMAKHYRPLLC